MVRNWAIDLMVKFSFQAIFGVAYTQDVDNLSEKLRNVESHLENDVKVVKDSQSNLMTETKTELDEQKTKMTKVEDMAHELELKVREKTSQFPGRFCYTLPEQVRLICKLVVL